MQINIIPANYVEILINYLGKEYAIRSVTTDDSVNFELFENRSNSWKDEEDFEYEYVGEVVYNDKKDVSKMNDPSRWNEKFITEVIKYVLKNEDDGFDEKEGDDYFLNLFE